MRNTPRWLSFPPWSLCCLRSSCVCVFCDVEAKSAGSKSHIMKLHTLAPVRPSPQARKHVHSPRDCRPRPRPCFQSGPPSRSFSSARLCLQTVCPYIKWKFLLFSTNKWTVLPVSVFMSPPSDRLWCSRIVSSPAEGWFFHHFGHHCSSETLAGSPPSLSSPDPPSWAGQPCLSFSLGECI